MASKNKGKSPDESPDQFVAGTMDIAEKLQPHARTITVAVVVVFLALTGWFTYQYLGERAQAQATAIYLDALDISQRPVSPEEAEDGAEAEPPAGTDAEEFRSADARATATLKELERLQAEHGSTKTARSAKLLHASVLYDLGRYQEAADMYRAYLSGTPTPSLRWVALEGLGYAQEAMALATEDESARNAALTKSLETFRQIQSGDQGPHRDYALYHEARILAMLGQNAEAIAALEKAIEVAPESLLTNDIKQRLAQLEAPATE